jgi:metal-responsive CopG/Arc/MetJ family transcriptional regulator
MSTYSDALTERRLDQLARLLRRHEKKAKTSLSLSAELIEAADVIAGRSQRSAFVERAVRAYIRHVMRQARHHQDLEAIDARADVTNRESDGLLDLQAWPE